MTIKMRVRVLMSPSRLVSCDNPESVQDHVREQEVLRYPQGPLGRYRNEECGHGVASDRHSAREPLGGLLVVSSVL